MSADIAPLAPKLAPIIARMGSTFDGERLACVAAIERLLASHGLGFVDLAAALGRVATASTAPIDRPSGDDDDLIDAALASSALTAWEYKFALSLRHARARGRKLTEKQRDVLRGIFEQRCAA